MIDFEKELNPEQLRVVLEEDPANREHVDAHRVGAVDQSGGLGIETQAARIAGATMNNTSSARMP